MTLRCDKNAVIAHNLFDAQREVSTAIEPEALADSIRSPGRTVVMGGHYYVHRDAPDRVGMNAQRTWNIACLTAKHLATEGVEAKVSLLMNDGVPLETHERTAIRSAFKFPAIFKRILTRHGLSRADIMGFESCSAFAGPVFWERLMANRFQSRFRRRFPSSAGELSSSCQRAAAEYVRQIDAQGARTLALVVPGCSHRNFVHAARAAKRAIPHMNLYVLAETGNCYD